MNKKVVFINYQAIFVCCFE